LIVIFANIKEMPHVLALICREAFHPTAVAGGVFGTIIIGLRRSVQSNEAGTGAAAIVYATAQTKEHVSQGFVALLETFASNVDSSLSDIASKLESVDSSLESLDSSIANLDASVQTLTNIDASLQDHESRIQQLEASLGYLLDNNMYNLKENIIKPVIEEHLRYLGLLD
jgi:flagellin-like hook-associated protein FlgL